MRVSIDSERCTGHGRCYMLVPDLFRPDRNGHGEVIVAEVPPGLPPDARKAAGNCPEGAIVLSE